MSQVISIFIFLVVMAAIVSEKLHRTAAACAGAVALLLFGILSMDKAVGYIDFDTVGLLVGMMVFVGIVRRSGIFEFIAIKTAKIAKGDPWRIMMLFIIVTAVLSAFLDNVTTVLLIGPMSISIANILGINPIPFLMTQIMASNIGGTATLIGDPPNIMIGSAAGLSFMDFIKNTAPIVIIILVAFIFLSKILYGKKMFADNQAKLTIMELDEYKAIEDKSLLRKSVVMMVIVIAGFALHSVIHIDSSVIALSAGAVMMVIGKQEIDEIIADVEWTTILFFIGLFVVVGGLIETGTIDILANAIIDLTKDKPIMTMLILLWSSALLSCILDNIPFVATLIPLVSAMAESGVDVVPLWWAISLGACLGGNGTIIGASANVVLTDISSKHGYPISFNQFFKMGFPVMLMSVAISTVYMVVRYGIL